ncbi:MAG TPA: hypothetical protein VHN14_14550 [Kofleriaceae bacterium]|jgi:hypothetical protein|nr:hypothetical protein [Kofleriaceae bacterium]
MNPVIHLATIVWLGAACGATSRPVQLTEEWPAAIRTYDDVVQDWTRRAELRADYQEVCELVATLKSAEWRAAHATHDADIRGLAGDARAQYLAQARAEVAGPFELEVMVTTWDRRENDLDRGKKSVWRIVLIDETGREIEPIEIVRDRRPAFVVRAEFPALGEFATPYIVRFPRAAEIFGSTVKQVRLRMSSPRGGLEVVWKAP